MRAGAYFVAATAASLALASPAAAATRVYHDPPIPMSPSQSTNWAGYADTGSFFTDVKGTWVQPAVSCQGYQSTFSAFWVGLGGYSGDSGGLEQTGTESDCEDGQPVYNAWYELLPDSSVSIPIVVSPGDTIAAEVSVDEATVTLTITDQTNGQSFTTQQTPDLLDTSSAEWIAEAPSRCFGSRCLALRLANFGTVDFSGSSTTANGHVGTISDASWSANAIELGGRTGGAIPASLSPDGSGFSVAFTAPVMVQPPMQVPRPKAKPKPKPKPHRRGGGV